MKTQIPEALEIAFKDAQTLADCLKMSQDAQGLIDLDALIAFFVHS